MKMNMNVQEKKQLHAGTTEKSAIYQTPGRNWLRVGGIFFIFAGIYGFITLINICNNMMYDGNLNISIGDSYYARYLSQIVRMSLITIARLAGGIMALIWMNRLEKSRLLLIMGIVNMGLYIGNLLVITGWNIYNSMLLTVIIGQIIMNIVGSWSLIVYIVGAVKNNRFHKKHITSGV